MFFWGFIGCADVVNGKRTSLRARTYMWLVVALELKGQPPHGSSTVGFH
jgi:hypothetical protein